MDACFLPNGKKSAEFPYFPDPAFAVIWRNWGLVSADRIAKALDSNEETVCKWAARMGLTPHPSVSPLWKQRGFLTIIRNGSNATLKSVSAQWSSSREGIARILKECGYIAEFAKIEKNGLPVIEITLKYNGKKAAITEINRISKPGRRIYTGYSEIPKVIGGMGISILTTSKGILSDVEARQQKVGGEVLAQVW